MLVLNNKRDAYYVVTPKTCSCPDDEFAPLLEELTDQEQEEAVKVATDRFFNCRLPGLKGKYAVVNLSLTRGLATEDELKADAARFGIDPAIYPDHWQQMLMEQLEELFDEELFNALLWEVDRKKEEKPDAVGRKQA